MHKPIDKPIGSGWLSELDKRPSDATLNLQRDLLDVCVQFGRDWVARSHKEMEFWSQHASVVAASRSIPEAVGAYQACIAERMQMAMDDGLRFFKDYQDTAAKLARSSSWTCGSTAHNSSPTRRRA